MTLFQESGSGNLNTTSSLSIDPRGNFASASAPDAYIYFSGTIGNDGSANNKKLVIGGDVVISGNLHFATNTTVFSQNNNANAKRTTFSHGASGLDFGSVSAVTRVLAATALTNFSTGEIRFVANSVQAAAFKTDKILQLGSGDATTTPGNFHLRFTNASGSNINAASSVISCSFQTGTGSMGQLEIVVPKSGTIVGSTPATPTVGMILTCPTSSNTTVAALLWTNETGVLTLSKVLVGGPNSFASGSSNGRVLYIPN